MPNLFALLQRCFSHPHNQSCGENREYNPECQHLVVTKTGCPKLANVRIGLGCWKNPNLPTLWEKTTSSHSSPLLEEIEKKRTQHWTNMAILCRYSGIPPSSSFHSLHSLMMPFLTNRAAHSQATSMASYNSTHKNILLLGKPISPSICWEGCS